MCRPAYPENQTIRTLPMGGKPIVVSVPGSKSITNRALVLAALTAPSQGTTLTGALHSEDTEVMVESLRRLGFQIEPRWEEAALHVRRPEGARIIPVTHADLFIANSGTSMRFLTAMAALGKGRYRLDGVPRMRERPIEDLLEPLRQLGVSAHSETGNGCPPVLIQSVGLPGGTVRIKVEVSSQFLSALLMAAPFAREPLTIRLEGNLVSEPYIEMTIRMMADFGLAVQRRGEREYYIPLSRSTGLATYAIEPDASAASYFFAAAAILNRPITVSDLTLDSLQGDVRFVEVLQQMGCRIETCDAGITVHGGTLRGVDIDMNAISDTVMTLGAVACFASGPTTIRNVAHIRHKETDRIAALATELRKLGASVDEFPDGMRITPGALRSASIETYHDHRMAMSLALVGLRVEGIEIRNPGCVAKTYPDFWQDLDRLR